MISFHWTLTEFFIQPSFASTIDYGKLTEELNKIVGAGFENCVTRFLWATCHWKNVSTTMLIKRFYGDWRRLKVGEIYIFGATPSRRKRKFQPGGSLTNWTHSDKDIKAGTTRFFWVGVIRTFHFNTSHTEIRSHIFWGTTIFWATHNIF